MPSGINGRMEQENSLEALQGFFEEQKFHKEQREAIFEELENTYKLIHGNSWTGFAIGPISFILSIPLAKKPFSLAKLFLKTRNKLTL